MNEKSFAFYGNSDFHMTFSNGMTISIRCGFGSYSENGDRLWCGNSNGNGTQSNNAEVAVFHNGKLIDANLFRPNGMEHSQDTVIGWASANDIADIIFAVKNATPDQIKAG